MQLFGTTSRCADYIKISNQLDQQYCQKNTAKLQIFCPFVYHFSRTALVSTNFFCTPFLLLLNLDLISFWETSAIQRLSQLHLKPQTHI
ncbi:hypothetical protein O3M35_008797 [Rhynocoris fuscipes]|uniref:Uncharacterized protein n=1 Tax=Rhynocoris fuscipes TaxID=488301 RepID=A0AAW1D859_9HEMI